MSRTATGSRKGFTLVELAVVIVIIGVLAAFGVPQFLKSVERSKCAEAFNYLSALRSAQERFVAKNGIYWGGTIAGGTMTNDAANGGGTGTEQLDISQTAPKYFSGDGTAGGTLTVNEAAGATGKPTWDCTLERVTATSSYGGYTVTYNQDGYLPLGVGGTASLDISTLPEINPMGN